MVLANTTIPGFVSQRLFNRAESLFMDMKQAECESKGFVDPISQRMRLLGRSASTYAETMVQARLEEYIGYDISVKNMGDSSQSNNDLVIVDNETQREYRLEVKSAQEKASGDFFFQGIDPNKFDYIVLVFIGKEGTFMQIGDRYYAGGWIEDNCRWYDNDGARPGYGYRATKHNDYRHSRMRGEEVFFDMSSDQNITTVLTE